MGKQNISAFEILFNNGSGVFYSGENIQGYVSVELTEPLKTRGIKVSFEGKAYVRWTESQSSGSGQNRRTTHYTFTDEEKYFDQDALLFGIWPGQGSGTRELHTGKHTFPFEFQLPKGLPSSFEEQIGHVRYTIRSTIDALDLLKHDYFDLKAKQVFSIISILDLNQQPNVMARLQGTKQKRFCCLCCKSAPIEANFHIERSGYVPGEAVKLHAEISNGSSRRIKQSYIALEMVTTFHVRQRSKTWKTEVARVTRPGIVGHGNDFWTGEQLIIPPLPPSFLDGCKLIDIRYILQLYLEPSGPATDFKIPLDIIIGTVPLRSVIDQHPPMLPVGYNSGNMYEWESNPTAPPGGKLYPLPPSGLPNLPPPSYNECITGRYNTCDTGDDEHTRGNMEYAPVYTFYNWGHALGPMPVQSKKVGQ
ncbi:unnamed protein product [Lymnaea stagnalis]|uniref:Arrestin C-terminal-like domain-containing protein n=1 Tax=Lymnaea stagnalis TaxID=6523 RepID=A0AAV2I304_LYMST